MVTERRLHILFVDLQLRLPCGGGFGDLRCEEQDEDDRERGHEIGDAERRVGSACA